jgi:phospholipase/carboxylesterase
MTTTASAFIHRYEPGRADRPPLLLLHGTGGDENDLLDLGRAVAPGSPLLSPRGQVLENGMPRFFRRLSEGVFDEGDLERRAQELADFVEHAGKTHGLGPPVALGFSNGANIASAALLLRPSAFSGAILLRGMMPFREPRSAALERRPVLVLSGALDPLVSEDEAAGLAEMLRTNGADVDHRIVPAGHGLSDVDLKAIERWLSLL